MPIALRYAARSHTGLVRQTNQDSGYAGPHLLVVADGMGGHAAGDVASSVAIGHLVHLDDDTAGSRALSLLESAIADANDELAATTAEHPEMAGMGTTVTAILRTDRKLAVAHIGDSRAYLLRGGELTQITKDHTYVQRLVDEGRITAEEAEHHPQGNLVTRVLTGQPGDEPDTSWREARPGDRFLLCSDGISGYIAGDTIRDVVAACETPQQAADRLIDLALRSGAPDNATAIVADVVSLTDGPTPSLAPQVVGAAAARRQVAQAEPRTPAEKAAALTREATGTPEPDADQLRLAEEGEGSRRRTLLRLLALAAVLALVLGAAGYGFWRWSRSQYYIAADGDVVAVYQGLDQSLLGVRMSSVEERSTVRVADLPSFYRSRVAQHVAASSLDDARSTLQDLRSQADACRAITAQGGYCGDAAPAAAPTPVPTVSSTATAVPSQTASITTTVTPPATSTGRGA